MLAQLTKHKDLGLHTEMMSDGVMHLVEAGVITGRRKTLLPGKLVTSFIMGCGGRRRVLAYLTEGAVLRRSLRHLPKLPPPLAPARGPPQQALWD
ncbi:hypothetical protein [Archangium lansingense]|uniref:Uncharacterized protein n=1 Tax=Archangium lansingense TaxID=2995310 RepID=A0ABT4AD41_9BACT|nr:hypothetical protein [Archangium lansinium]MCY1079593.1 hypothetical protein [Archangium lansinium]